MHTHTTSKVGSDTLLTRKDVEQRWGVSIETVKRREKDGTLSPVYLPGGRLVRYRLSEILKLEGGQPR